MNTFKIHKNNFNNISYISSDSSVIELYFEYGDDFHSHIDGQFLLIVRDGYHLDFFTDPWGSYQVNYLNNDDNFCHPDTGCCGQCLGKFVGNGRD